ncbi:unnamed protein product [Mytilus coruscus]|uniref:Reverse transcriptase domain-containing protein n=1 Tax=Mytilus coruscus TaxID=42192 RepID=A0A6J8CNY3_MYTCO|nr:unnamed protein product [Mytilus coruscus]
MCDLNLSVWEKEIQDDFGKDFILHGIQFGFDIVESLDIPPKVQAKNHPSAMPSSPLYSIAHDQILVEIENGNYTIEDATKLVTPNCYMSKVDLKSAYRSVKISEASQKVTGFRWIFPNGKEYTLFDRKLPFGSKLAPSIFHRLSQAVRRMMARRGFTTVAYLDDFFICEKTKSRCREGMNLLITLLRALWFSISWSKVVDPCQQLTFLGVVIDSSKMEVRLPSKKLAELKADLADFSKRVHATKKRIAIPCREIKLGFCSGKENVLADMISRLHVRSMCESFMRFYLPCPLKSNLLVPPLQDFDPNRHLSRQNIQFHPEGVNKTKTIQFSERSLEVQLPAIRNSPLCPAQALMLSFKLVQSGIASCPAFLFKEGGQIVPLPQCSFLARLKDSLKEIGIDPIQYSGHSFRRGEASFAFKCGIPGELIQAQGDWKSDTYKRYLDPSFPTDNK